MKMTSIVAAIIAVGIALGIAIYKVEPRGATEENAEAAENVERGPHGGRMLRQGEYAVELAIFEEGVPPEFHAYAYRGNKPVASKDASVTVRTTRLGGKVESFQLLPQGQFLRARSAVREPHSFDVKVSATVSGKALTWSYPSYEGRTQIPAETAQTAEVTTAIAGPATIREEITVAGRIIVDPTRSAIVRARFPGVLRELHKGLGDHVRKNEVLATVESNESLQPYTIRAPVEGTVIALNVSVGEVVGETPIMEVSDVSRVIAELHAFPRDAARLKPGQPVTVRAVDGEIQADVEIYKVMPTANVTTQTAPVRMIIDNPDGLWRFGRLVEGRITVGAREVPLAVDIEGLQNFRDFDVVFANVGDLYEVRMLTLGARDGQHAEVTEGLDPGTAYVTKNSFLVKADIEKSGAHHE